MFLEDAGFDWKVLGPDVSDVDYVAWQSDQDAYACSGQKCSAQSILFMHENWANAGAQGLGFRNITESRLTYWACAGLRIPQGLGLEFERVGVLRLAAVVPEAAQRSLCHLKSSLQICSCRTDPEVGYRASAGWASAGFEEKIKALAAKRKLEDLSIGPVLTWTTERMLEHVKKVAAIPGEGSHHVAAVWLPGFRVSFHPHCSSEC